MMSYTGSSKNVVYDISWLHGCNGKDNSRLYASVISMTAECFNILVHNEGRTKQQNFSLVDNILFLDPFNIYCPCINMFKNLN